MLKAIIRPVKLILITIALIGLFLQPAEAKNKVFTDIKVILASTGSKHVDPGLRSIIPELKSVFRYTSYELLNEKKMNLDFSQKGQVALPGKRILEVTPLDMDGRRIRYRIIIRKARKVIFKTQVLLKNNSSITIGGPKFKKGTLLFNIAGSAR